VLEVEGDVVLLVGKDEVVVLVPGSVVDGTERMVVVDGRVVVVDVVAGVGGMGRMIGRGGLGLPSLGGTGPTITAMRLASATRPDAFGCT